MRLSVSLVAPLLALTAGCASVSSAETTRTIAPILTSEEARDALTYAKPLEARVTHVDLDLTLDFAAKRVAGSATLDIDAAPDAREIILDSKGLSVASVTDQDGQPLGFTIGEDAGLAGAPFTIRFGADGGAAPEKIAISYASGPDAEALQWLSPEQTAGGEKPFMFSQGQAILNRSWIPTQDSPGIRQSWEAKITAPQDLKVVMSGILQGEPEPAGEGMHRFSFTMDKTVPPYLIAIAVGDIAFAELGPRSGVWAEPSMLEVAKAELVDTEAMIDAAEAIYGPYRWGRYDMIVLPPSFPYGGMENPVMTFLTPTFIAGDRSNTGLVAHELAHSWSGNLVTYASWSDGWLNEGVTSYFESRISESVFGKKRAEQEYALSYGSLVAMVEERGADNPVTAMRTPDSITPFDTAGEAIYDKGTVFLRTVEQIIGREKFDEWMRGWFDSHAFQPATSEMWLAEIREGLIKGDAELEAKLMLDEWIYGTGIPSNAAKPDPQAFAEVDAAAKRYGENRILPVEAWSDWTGAEQMRFMRKLPELVNNDELAMLDDALGVSKTGNNEVLFLWLEAALRNRYQPAVPQAEAFLSRIGRNKFVAPLYKAMSKQGEWGMAIAKPLYAKTRAGYHSYTRSQVDPLLGWEG
ncbi:M1 family metallopeptidase [Alterisphingorhabdus coralli]|uniref:Aminopeptidase N n=1 Tax=Alterisphingorhabdus coralli TaxID=3071408 RepID=A0AA97I1E3_9SPHN|nr:M1 family metallopeptidase [Parasphingorhabdus sp. SCSIO 66989]WOE74645.1 M1 family metallopeptidase [Parasphingorhabdus sp. SCSIO 66989]